MTDAFGAFLDGLTVRSSGIVIEGPPGIGKSFLWTRAAATAREQGWLVMSAQPAEAEIRLGGLALVDLFHTIGDDQLAALPEPQREALGTALLRTRPTERSLEPGKVVVAVANLIRHLAMTHRVLIAIDDVQWLDESTATILGYLARRPPATNLGFLLAQRDLADGRLASPADELASSDLLLRHVVTPKRVNELLELIPRRLGRHVPNPILKRAAESSGGNPFYALELARFWLTGPDSASRLPPSLTALVHDRIAVLSADGKLAAAAAAAQAKPTLAILRALDLAGGIGQVERAGVVTIRDGAIAFTHPLLATAAYQSCASPERADIHRRLAEVVDEPEQKARHRALGSDYPDIEIAAMLDEARDSALARADSSAAIELARLAVALTPPSDSARAQRLLELGELIGGVGHVDEARSVLEPLTAASAPSAVRARALIAVAMVRFYGDSYDEAASAAGAALVAAEEAGEADLIVDAHLVLSLACEDTDADASRLHAQRAFAAVSASAAPEAERFIRACSALIGTGIVRGEAIPEDLYAQAVRMSPVLADRHGLTLIRANWLGATGRLDEAWDAVSRLRLRSIHRGDPVADLSRADYFASGYAIALGDLASADELAREHARLAEGTGQQNNRNWADYSTLFVQYSRGDFDHARETANALLADAEESSVRAFAYATLGAVEIVANRPDDAVRALAAAIEVAERSGQLDSRLAGRLAVPLALAGDVDRANEVLRLHEPGHDSVEFYRAAAATTQAIAAASSGDEATALAAFDRALSHYASERWYPLERARVLTLQGQTLRRFRRRTAAKETLAAARAVYDTCGAPGWVAYVDGELARIGLRRAAADLTTTERRVAELAATGATSRNISAALFMSVRSVEANLTRVYRKLGISSRAELGVRLSATATESAHPRASPQRDERSRNAGGE